MKTKRLPRAKLAAMFPLTAEDLKELSNCANAVWNNIGYDVLQAVGEGDAESASLSRRDVIEIVVDADRLAEEVRRSTHATPALKALFPEPWNREAADYRDLLLRDIFTFPTYGL